jgi:hypothetical protein
MNNSPEQNPELPYGDRSEPESGGDFSPYLPPDIDNFSPPYVPPDIDDAPVPYFPLGIDDFEPPYFPPGIDDFEPPNYGPDVDEVAIPGEDSSEADLEPWHPAPDTPHPDDDSSK